MFTPLVFCTFLLCVLADVSHVVKNRPFPSQLRNRAYPSALPAPPSPVTRSSDQVGIVRQTQDVDHEGNYQFSFETENGITAEEQGQIRSVGPKPEDVEKVAQGSFSWTSPEGERINIAYVADGTGYHPEGSHIPPVPPAIQRALDWIAAHPEPQESNNVYKQGQRRY